MAIRRICQVCNKTFYVVPAVVKNGGGKYCSRECQWESLRNKIAVPCEVCGKEFETVLSRLGAGRGKYCSKECSYIGRTKCQPVICEYCGQEFEAHPSNLMRGYSRFCSRACRNAELRGMKHHHWKDRINKTCAICSKIFKVPQALEHAICCSPKCGDKYRSQHYSGDKASNWQGGKSFEPYDASFNKEFKKTVRERDGYICIICRLPGYHVHHIDYNKLNTTLENCITLCNSCHSKVNHKRGYWQVALNGLVQRRTTICQP